MMRSGRMSALKRSMMNGTSCEVGGNCRRLSYEVS